MTDYSNMTIAEIIYDYAVVRGDLSEPYARRQLAAIIQDQISDLESEVALYKRGAKTLGEIVDRHVEDLLRWAGMEDQIGNDDPDQQTAWELVAEMPETIRRVRRLVADWQANAGSRGLGDPTADTWNQAARQLLDALGGAE